MTMTLYCLVNTTFKLCLILCICYYSTLHSQPIYVQDVSGSPEGGRKTGFKAANFWIVRLSECQIVRVSLTSWVWILNLVYCVWKVYVIQFWKTGKSLLFFNCVFLHQKFASQAESRSSVQKFIFNHFQPVIISYVQFSLM